MTETTKGGGRHMMKPQGVNLEMYTVGDTNIGAYFELEGKRYKADLVNLPRLAGRPDLIRTPPMELMIFELGKNGKSKKNGDPEYEQYHDEFSYRVVFKDINDFIAGKRQKAGGKNHD